MTATAEARREAAEKARRFAGWIVWVTAQGHPVATRSGRQRPPEPYDGNWAQTIMADDWDQLETELAAQARYDAERLTNQATHGLQYQTCDTCRPYSRLEIADRIERLVEPADDTRRGDLADLLTGPADAEKSMTASALATELSLPLVTIRTERQIVLAFFGFLGVDTLVERTGRLRRIERHSQVPAGKGWGSACSTGGYVRYASARCLMARISIAYFPSSILSMTL